MSEKSEALQSLLKTLEHLHSAGYSQVQMNHLSEKIDEIVMSIAKNDQPTAALQNGEKQ